METVSRLSHFPMYQVFEDFCKICSCSLHNAYKDNPIMAKSCYRDLYESRENEYLKVVGKYKKEVFNDYFPLMLANLTSLLLQEPKDYLGTIFEKLNLSQHFNGQFFTPPHICEFMAEITLGNEVENAIKEKGYFRVAEPACGSGAMVIGLVRCMKNRGYDNLGGKIYIEATDIDALCVDMTYTQLSLLGLSVRVIHGNSLTMETFNTWDSPNLQVAKMAGYFN